MKKFLKSKKQQKGFTLIEIIVVLVILAILAAATVPAMLGFVDEARGKAFVAEARTAMLAAQTCVTEDYTSVANPANSTIKGLATLKSYQKTGGAADTDNETGKFARMLAPDVDIADVTSIKITNGVVEEILYFKGGYYVKIIKGSTTETSRTPITITGATA